MHPLRVVAALFAIAACSQSAWACRTPLERLSAQQQLAYASDVSLARVVRATPSKQPGEQAIDEARLVETALAPVWGRDAPGLQARQAFTGTSRPGRPHPVEYEFLVEKRFLGPGQPSFTIMGTSEEPDGARSRPEADFRQEAFWAPGGGRLVTAAGACYPSPSFVIGERYLIFQGRPMGPRSAEHVATVDGHPDPDDQWFKYVEKTLDERASARQPK